ncbi:Putative Pol polyprotein, partial [Buceros rhinoceros silvestris]
FAFTLPSTNQAEPSKRFEWAVLPQGMKNSPTLCQLYFMTNVAWALRPVRAMFHSALIYHYMDDILIARQTPITDAALQTIHTVLGKSGLVIAPENIQRSAPWKYLGWRITDGQVRPQKIELHTDIKTLKDAQRLLRELQWIRSIVGITNDDLAPLLSWLTGIDAGAPRTCSAEQRTALQQITRKL